MELGVLDLDVVGGLGAPDELVEGDAQDIGDVDERIDARGGVGRLPAVVDPGADVSCSSRNRINGESEEECKARVAKGSEIMQEGIDALVDYASSEAGEQCIAAGLGSVYAGAEDLATLGGVGLALKGLKGAALSTRVSATVRRVLYENSLALHPGVGANPSTVSRLIGGFVVGTGVDAGFEEAGGGSYNGRAFLTGLLPVANFASATTSAVETCRGR